MRGITNKMEYKFVRDGKEEIVQPELWQWVAYYNDGTVLRQFDIVGKEGELKGVFHQFKEIDQSKLKAFKMVSQQFPQVYAIPFDPKRMKLIHFYRRTGFDVGLPTFREIKVYVFGYESKVLFKNVKHLMMIIPNGEIIMMEDPNIISFE